MISPTPLNALMTLGFVNVSNEGTAQWFAAQGARASACILRRRLTLIFHHEPKDEVGRRYARGAATRAGIPDEIGHVGPMRAPHDCARTDLGGGAQQWTSLPRQSLVF